MDEPFNPAFFRRLQQLKIRTRRAYLGSRQGSHESQQRGHGLEFADFRPYTAGDDFRHIDWGIYGRTDRVYVRQFRAEQDLSVLVLLDTSNSMAYPIGAGKFVLARNLALAFGFIALCDGDAVTYSMLGHGSTPTFTGQRSFGRANLELKKFEPGGSFNLLSEVRAAVAAERYSGKCFFISDFMLKLEDTLRSIDHLRSRNYDVTVIQVLAPEELNLNIDAVDFVVDAETGDSVELMLDNASKREYALQLGSHVEALEKHCVKNGIVHMLVSSAEKLNDIVLTRLPQAGILR